MPAITPPVRRVRFDSDAILRLSQLLLDECLPRGGMPLEAVDGLFSGALVSPGAPLERAEVMQMVTGTDPEEVSEELDGLLALMWDATQERILRGATSDPAQCLPLIAAVSPLMEGWDAAWEEDVAQEQDETASPAFAGAGAAPSDEVQDGESDDDEDDVIGAAWALGFASAYGLRTDEWEARLDRNPELGLAVMDIFDLLPRFDSDMIDELEDLAEDDEDDFDLFDDDDFELPALDHLPGAEDIEDEDFDDDFDEDDFDDEDFDEDDAPISLEARTEIIAALPDILYHLHLERIDEQTTRIPVRRVAAPGRNDLCPCGSGKKFKKCHGDPSRLN